MVDVFSRAKRSEVMSRIRAKNTKPEVAVRRALHALGFRFRLHAPRLPGRPDIVLARHSTIIQVKGCFWHGHVCLKGRVPQTNQRYWVRKIQGNIRRDRQNARRLRAMGWNVRTIWECRVRRWPSDRLTARLKQILSVP